MERRTIAALALSFVVIFSYPYILGKFFPQYAPKPPVKTIQATGNSVSAPTAAVPGAVNPIAALPTSSNLEQQIESHRIGSYLLDVAPKTASITTVGFTTYFNFEKNVSEPLIFLKTSNPNWGVGAIGLSVDGKEEAPVFTTSVQGRQILSSAQGQSYKIDKTFDIGNSNYSNGLSINYTNTSSAAQNVQLRVVAGSGLVVRNAIDTQYFETNWVSASAVEHVKAGNDKSKVSTAPLLATSVKSRHFSSLLKPSQGHSFLSATNGVGKNDYAASLIGPSVRVEPGQTLSESFDLFIGPNTVEYLAPLGLEHVVNFGKLDAICKLLLGMMQMVHGIVQNYGVAIFLLTVGLNLILFPLTKASFDSMRRMQLVQPQMARIKEKYSKDPTKMNKEMMELYKRHKVNPMGGCLPMILQMPVFISLYVALCKSTDLLNARFLWIDDLASPDAVRLPFSLPLFGDAIHVLPLVMVVAMFIQQKITTSAMPSTDPNVAQQQKMMAYIMPPFFGFIFYPMPSGLVIYWLTNTIVMTAIQFTLRRIQPVVPLPEHA